MGQQKNKYKKNYDERCYQFYNNISVPQVPLPKLIALPPPCVYDGGGPLLKVNSTINLRVVLWYWFTV